ncbi:hypothetical protein KC19_4G031700 [Ceratodon purpureus]|uniref:Ubiquitin thioesterase OTU n=1 Tax=Ceratodon purpureus TaxID=3225 RepID=A0A8T0I4X4_CERPU|nr:hypothetical protein KC19_4G031700 [Ceratodon purpureus]
MGDESVVVRRVIPSDNSCLFNAVGYVMDKDKHKSKELRQVIAAAVMSDPATYTEAILGKPNQDYVEWISKPEKWGGAIELAILSDFYGREIAAYDIQTKRCDVYGQDKGYTERVMLIYDGLHYDALGLAPFPDAPEEVDQTIFSVDKSGNIGSASRLAERVVEEAHRYDAHLLHILGRMTFQTWQCDFRYLSVPMSGNLVWAPKQYFIKYIQCSRDRIHTPF